MSDSPANALKARLRADMLTAMKDKRRADVATFRSILAAVDNAEAPAQSDGQEKEQFRKFGDDGAEVTRLDLSEADLRDVLLRESAERLELVAQFRNRGMDERASSLQREAELIEAYLSA